MTWLLVSLLSCLCLVANGEDPAELGALACGGSGGVTEFNDQDYFLDYGAITRIEVWHGLIIDGFRFTYGTQVTPVRGSTGASLYTYPLAPGEEIVGIRLTRGRESFEYNDVLCQIQFYIRRSDGLIFTLPVLGECDKDSTPCGEYIPNQPMQYARGRYEKFVEYAEFVFEDLL